MPHLYYRPAIATCLVLTFCSFSVSPFNLSPWSRDVRLKKNTGLSNQLICRGLLSHGISGKRQRARNDLTCGLQISVRIRGKKSREEDYTNQAYNEYVKRLRPFLSLETHWYKTDEDLEAAVRKDAGVVVCLDENGRQMDSQAFSTFLFSKLEEGGSRVTFVVGGAEGLPLGLKSNPPRRSILLSLSSMTFTHLWARALLAEQIYRASEIRRGSQYHKE